MTFFSWLPQDGAEIVSPWLGLYGGFTVVLTTVTVWWLNRRSKREMATAKADLQKELDKDTDSTLFSRFTFSRSSSLRTKDIELGMVSR